MSWSVEFRVLGSPQPKGSARALLDRDGRPFVVPDNSKSRVWERAVALVASRVKPEAPLDQPLRLEVEFWLERPAKPKFAAAPAARIDLDKLLRSTGDALTGLIYVDDSRIVEIAATKKWGPPLGAQIRVSTVEDKNQLDLALGQPEGEE